MVLKHKNNLLSGWDKLCDIGIPRPNFSGRNQFLRCFLQKKLQETSFHILYSSLARIYVAKSKLAYYKEMVERGMGGEVSSEPEQKGYFHQYDGGFRWGGSHMGPTGRSEVRGVTSRRCRLAGR
jgi:hypothetical protein